MADGDGVVSADPLPDKMAAALMHARREVSVEDRDVPLPGPADALVEVAHCGICGTDLHYLLEWGPSRPGSIEGHEWSGTVVAVGADADPALIGASVVGGPKPKCGRCPHCLGGRPSLCTERGRAGVDEFQGAFATYKRVRADELLGVPEGLSLKHAALTEPLAVSMHAITRAGGPGAGSRWLVTGGGPIGYLAVAVLRAEGVEEVVVSEPHPARRELCERLGATSVHPDELADVPPMPMDVVDDAFDVALECSGRADAMEAALGLLDRGGTLVIVGSGLKAPRFDPNRILLNELVVTGANTYDEEGFPTALALLASGRLPLDLLVEPDDYPLEALLSTAEALGRGDLARKAMIAPGVGRPG